MKTDKLNLPTVEDIQAATSALNGFHTTMTFLRPLTPSERRHCGRMGTQAVRLTAQRLEAARQHRAELPPAFDLRQFERDTALLVALQDCLAASTRLQSDLRDTVLTLGAGTVQTGREVFAMIQLLATAANKLGRTVNNLKKRPRAPRREKSNPGAASAQPPPAGPPPAPASDPSQKAA